MDPDFFVGVAELYRQHKRLVDFINHLHDSLNRVPSPQEASLVLADFHEFAREHFSSEEDLLRRASFPDLRDHSIEHRSILRQLAGLLRLAEAGSLSLSPALVSFLRDGIRGHLLNTDKAYAPYLEVKTNR